MLAIETFRLKIQFFGFVLAKTFTESATSNFRVGEVQSISVFSQCVQNFHFDALQVLLLGKKSDNPGTHLTQQNQDGHSPGQLILSQEERCIL